VVALVGLALVPALVACGADPENPVPPEIFADCPASALPTPTEVAEVDGAMSVADLDPTGRFVVGTFTPTTVPAAEAPRTPVFRWDGDVPTLLPVPNGHANGVNRTGVVVGESIVAVDGGGTAQVAWFFHDSLGYVVLPTPDGYSGAGATAISDRGEIAGVAYRDDATAAIVVWRPTSTGYFPAVLAESVGAQANDITEDGTIVGQDDRRPYAWASDGTPRALQIPAGLGTGAAVQARGAWAAGYINANVSMIIRWNLRNDEIVIAGQYPQGSEFIAVSAIGNVAFNTGDGSVVDKYGDRYSLPVPDGTDAQTGGPVAISDNGMVLAGTYTDGGAVLWRCAAPAATATPTATPAG
jgi:uncharacterized membrane protein